MYFWPFVLELTATELFYVMLDPPIADLSIAVSRYIYNCSELRKGRISTTSLNYIAVWPLELIFQLFKLRHVPSPFPGEQMESLF